MEAQATPASHRITLFQVEDRGLSVLRTQRREGALFSAVYKLHAKNIPVERHESLMFATRKVTAEIFSTPTAIAAVYRCRT